MSKCSGLHCDGCGHGGFPAWPVVLLIALALTGGGVARAASDALTAIVIAVALCVVLAVAGMLALVIARVRRERLTYRPDPGITRGHVRAEVISVRGPERPAERFAARTPLQLPATRVDPLVTPERPAEGTREVTRERWTY